MPLIRQPPFGVDGRHATGAVGIAGPPWVLAVAGADHATRSAPPASPLALDFVATHAGLVADAVAKTSSKVVEGSHFAAGSASGVLANTLAKVRRILEWRDGSDNHRFVTNAEGPGALEDGVLDAGELLRAAQLAGEYWDQLPANPSVDGTPLALVVPLAPWAQTSWGYLGSAVSETITAVLFGAADREKDPEAEAYMNGVSASRAAICS